MPHRLLSKDVIIKSAIHIVSKNGFESLSIQSLARKLNVSPPSFYNHVDSMDEVLYLSSEKEI